MRDTIQRLEWTVLQTIIFLRAREIFGKIRICLHTGHELARRKCQQEWSQQLGVLANKVLILADELLYSRFLFAHPLNVGENFVVGADDIAGLFECAI